MFAPVPATCENFSQVVFSLQKYPTFWLAISQAATAASGWLAARRCGRRRSFNCHQQKTRLSSGVMLMVGCKPDSVGAFDGA